MRAASSASPAPDLVGRAPLEVLGPALASLPTDAHRSAFRLLLAAVVARWNLGEGDRSGWPSFVFCGPSKTAKTLLADGACRTFGLDSARHIRSLPSETERSCWGRLSQYKGGQWRFTPAAALGFPLVCWDELDKAPREVQRAVLRMLQGEVLVAGEGDGLVTVRPTVVLTGNGRPEHLPAEYLRRSVVLDTSPLVGDLGDVHEAAARFLDGLPRFVLDSLRPPVAAIPPNLAEGILRTARQGLTEAGWRACDERSLLHLTLGMAALRGDTDLQAAGLSVVGDYLACARTVGETSDPVPAVVPDSRVQALEAKRRRAREAEECRRVRAEVLRLATERAEVLDVLSEATPDPDEYGGSTRAEAIGLAARLEAAIRWVQDAESVEELDELGDELVELIDHARAWHDDHPALDSEGIIDADAWDNDEDDDSGPFLCRRCGVTFVEPAFAEDGHTWRCPSCGADKPLSPSWTQQPALPTGQRPPSLLPRIVASGGGINVLVSEERYQQLAELHRAVRLLAEAWRLGLPPALLPVPSAEVTAGPVPPRPF